MFIDLFKNRERENHTAHLKNLETELDAQVSRIAKQEREKAKIETDMEKRELEEKLQAELDEMKAQLKLFQKVHDLSSIESLKIMM